MEAAPLAELWGITWLWWWQIPILLAFICVYVIGGWLLLWVGGRFLAKSPAATLGRAFATNLLAGLAGFLAMVVAAGALMTVSGPAGPLLGWAAALLAYWLVVKGMFRVSFGKAVIAWLPTILVAVASIALLVTLMMPTLGRARELAQVSMCAGNLKAVGKAFQLYVTSHNGAPPGGIDALLEAKTLQPEHLKCPGARSGRTCDYFLHFPAEPLPGDALIGCDLAGNHRDGRRSALSYGGAVRLLTPSAFEAELARPINAAFAAALRQADPPPPPTAPRRPTTAD